MAGGKLINGVSDNRKKENTMKKILYGVLVMGLVFLLAGCASLVQKKLDSFMGMDILEAQKHFGYDFKTTKLNDGNTAYTWVRNRTAGFLSGSAAGGTGFLSGGMASNQCEFSFVADANGQIISNRFRDTKMASNTCWKLMD